MCLAIPGKIRKIKDNVAFFEYQDHQYEVDISLTTELKVGDWILMHDGRALSKITKKEAMENPEFIHDHEEASNHNHQ